MYIPVLKNFDKKKISPICSYVAISTRLLLIVHVDNKTNLR